MTRGRKVRPKTRSRQRRQFGFVLLIVVTVLAIVVLSLTRLSIQSLRQAKFAAEFEKKQRDHWRNFTLQRIVWNQAPAIWNNQRRQVNPSDRSERRENSPNFRFKEPVKIGNINYELILANENGKLPLAHLLEALPEEKVFAAANECITPSITLALNSTTYEESTAVNKWQNVLPLDAPQDLAKQGMLANENVTLWGNGRLNLDDASEECIHAMWKLIFGRPAPRRLFELQSWKMSASDWPQSLALGERDTIQFNTWFARNNPSFSLWIVPLNAPSEPTHFYVKWGESARPHFRHFIY